ncbi:PREDICTED: G patch domain-containing protein 2 isoform X2 [Nicrophorus vespilloides]|uniref:G patch domain-containing protein 2 isoform X2 n=1 Tax=Nicrophorus vespilloides TaxID=110193 RepID=A0ABM1NCY6_NICVS|nr:PREDICTED: G patch domain-containing protein 2 isoform X2 [Nicrophorus vespilloides]
MEHLAQDLSVALEESESCGPIALQSGRKWGMRRRTRSAGDDGSEGSSSSNEEAHDAEKNKVSKGKEDNNQNQSDSDDVSLSFTMSHMLKMKHPINNIIRGRYRKLGMSHSLESDSFNEHSPARPSMRRKRKLKRMSVDETPIPPVGKRKRPQRFEMIENGRSIYHACSNQKIKPLHQSVVDKIEKFCQPLDCDRMDTQFVSDSCELASESSLSWSGGEGHEGDDELTDWAPTQDTLMETTWNDNDSREFRAGCRRLGDERPGFSINTSANEKVARFLQDTSKSELRLCGAEREKLSQLAALYSLDLWFESPTSSLLGKTTRTPCMQPTQRHHSGHTAGHKRIRTQDHVII